MKPSQTHVPAKATPNADAALVAFDTADNVHTTCRKCRRRVAASKIAGKWTMAEHPCVE